ncbi:hypothetical protein [Streptomyces sp. TRM68367]|uniref:hypothetical protein n=1 Tax=Streptomyces sp. TRM68367 TaxID=2758415 RepID=UPI00165A8890|nr:hypothetical protein [Streptomyces sp. TRM68367]MBC9726617.1 hypothetical protein [Streptomyces sp. TRM68367]
MAVGQLPVAVQEFVNYLDGLLVRLDPGGGWCAVFWQRDPEGMQACLDGREVPPWDVVEALLQDLAAEYGPGAARPEAERARALHTAALAAYDARPGSRDALGDRLVVMLREQKHAAERQAELGRRLASATTREEADALRIDLAWARDDHARATARCAELRARMTELDHRALGGQARGPHPADGDGEVVHIDTEASPGDGGPRGRDAYGTGTRSVYDAGAGTSPEAARPGGQGQYRTGSRSVHDSGPGGRDRYDAGGPTMPRQRGGRYGPSAPAERGDRWGTGTGGQGPADSRARYSPSEDAREPYAPSPSASTGPQSSASPAPPADAAPKQRKRRRGSARFAGMAEEDVAPVAVPPAVVPSLPEPPAAATGRTLRGARFAGAAELAEVVEPVEAPQAETVHAGDRREVGAAVETLARLRKEGRSGEAHALLVDAAYWPAGRFPLLAAELQRAGLGADWATLLWEAASLPADRLVAAADALVAAGRDDDGQQILRQGVARPAGEIGRAVLELAGQGRQREVGALLDAYVRVRTPEEAARSAAPDPRTLVPLLLDAARGVSDERHWDLVHALRVAGFTA